jgi:hypothetical protein
MQHIQHISTVEDPDVESPRQRGQMVVTTTSHDAVRFSNSRLVSHPQKDAATESMVKVAQPATGTWTSRGSTVRPVGSEDHVVDKLATMHRDRYMIYQQVNLWDSTAGSLLTAQKQNQSPGRGQARSLVPIPSQAPTFSYMYIAARHDWRNPGKACQQAGHKS